jgi:hypothetical protein
MRPTTKQGNDTASATLFPFFRDQPSLHSSPRKTSTGVISEAKEGKFQRSTLPLHLPNWPGRQYTNLLRIPQVSLLVPGEGRRFCPVL